MRILLLTELCEPSSFGHGGMATYVKDLAVNLVERGHEVQVVSCDSVDTRTENIKGAKIIRIPHTFSHFRFVYLDKTRPVVLPIIDPAVANFSMKIIRRFRPDVVHAHGWTIFTASGLKLWNPKISVVGTMHDYGFVCPTRTYFNEVEKNICSNKKSGMQCLACAYRFYGVAKAIATIGSVRIFGRALNKLDKVIAISTYVAKVAKYSGLKNVEVVPNFITLERLENPDSNFEGDPTDILYVGALTPYKGVDVILKAYRLITKMHDRQRKLVLIGPKHQGFHLKTQSDGIRTFSNMPREFVLNQFQKAKVVVVPSIWAEPFGLVTLEAMAFKKPVVASSVGGLNDIVLNDRTGLLVPPSNPQRLAKALEYILDSPQVQRTMGTEGRRRVEEIFSSEKILPKIEAIYEEVKNSAQQ